MDADHGLSISVHLRVKPFFVSIRVNSRSFAVKI
jgi:hypothetical protein